MSSGKISVIVAVYNTETYLSRCVESVLAQSYKNIELLLVDDGSQDRSGDICDGFAAADGRVRVIHKENEGLSVARNTALKIADGEYVAFIDSDDVLCPTLFEYAVHAMEKTGSPIAKYTYCTEEENLFSGEIADDYETINGVALTEKILKDEFGSQLWQYLFKKELWDGVVSPPGRLAQDMMVLHRVTANIPHAVLIPHDLYYYYQDRKDNVSNANKKGVRGTVDRSYAYWLRCDFCRKNETYLSVFDFCLMKATSYTVSSFCNKELYAQERYKADRELFRANIKAYRKEIARCPLLSGTRKICALLIRLVPKAVPLLGKLRLR